MSKVIKSFSTTPEGAEAATAYLKEVQGFESSLNYSANVIIITTEMSPLVESQLDLYRKELQTYFNQKIKSVRNLNFIEKKLSEGETTTVSKDEVTGVESTVNLVDERNRNESVIRVCDEQMANVNKLIDDLKKNG